MQDIFILYQDFRTELEHAKKNPNAAQIFTAVAAYDLLHENLNSRAQEQLERLVCYQLPAEWQLWRRFAESYRRWPEVFCEK